MKMSSHAPLWASLAAMAVGLAGVASCSGSGGTPSASPDGGAPPDAGSVVPDAGSVAPDAGAPAGATPTCTTLASQGSTLTAQWGSCDAGVPLALGNTCSGTYISRCSTAYNTCAPVDEAVLDGLARCITQQPMCHPGQEQAWLLTLSTCFSRAGTLSVACQGDYALQFPDGGC